MPEVIMPKMGDAMEEGTILQWLKSEGDEVEEGDAIAEIETDKVSMEIEAEDSGTLAQILAEADESVAVGEAIAFIQGEGEEAPDREASGGGEEEAEAEEGGEEDGGGGQATETEENTEEEAGGEEESSGGGAQANGQSDGNFRASPIVRRLANENDLDLGKVDGSGPQGRIVERDVRAAMESGEAQAGGAEEDGAAEQPSAPQQAQAPAASGAEGTELMEMTKMQSVIAERMTEAKQTVPHFYATVEIDATELMALRKQLNGQLEEEGVKISVNDFVMKACAVALTKEEHKKLNSLWTADGIELHEQVDMAMAVALEAGLITPVIKDAANKTLSAISSKSKDLAKRARDGGLKPEEYQGGTVTVSNMGMFGVESFSAIINPPQAAIIAVSSIMQRAGFKDDEVVPVSIMKLTLSADHRIANGAEGAQYMAEVQRLLESPMTLVV